MCALRRRPAFTLVEMLLVLGVIVLIATLLVPITLRTISRSNVPQAVQQLQILIGQAKTRAMAEKRPQGIRLHPMENSLRTTASGVPLNWYDRVQFIEDPGPFAEGFIWSPVTDPPPGNPKLMRMPMWNSAASGIETFVLTSPPIELTNVDVTAQYIQNNTPGLNFRRLVYGPFGIIPGSPLRKQIVPFSFDNAGSAASNFVQVGDYLEIKGVGQLYRIELLLAGTPSPLRLDRPLTQDIEAPVHGFPNYRIIRAPRPVPNMPIKPLASGVIIDLTPPTAGAALGVSDRDTGGGNGSMWMRGVSAGYPAPNTLLNGVVDIMFSPTGQVLAAPADIMYFWVHTHGNPTAWANREPLSADGNADNQALVVIYCKTGQVASFPVEQGFPPANPWFNAQRGRAQGVGGM